MIEALQNQVIPWANAGASIALLNTPPTIFGAPKVVEKLGTALPSLQGVGQVVRVRYWREENLNSAAIPILGCILEGEADLEVGITQAACRKLKIQAKRWIVAMPQASFFLAVPGTPISAPRKVHWRRPNPEKAYSRMLWIQIHKAGAYCHFNTSSQGKLWISPHVFLSNPQIFPLASNVIQEMQLSSPRQLPITYFHLGLILEYLLQSLLLSSRSEPIPITSALSFPSRTHSPDERMQNIIAYIEQNLANPLLSTESLAAQFHLSGAHLRRLFQREFSTSMMKFVAQRRLELACQLLLESSFNIEQISRYCGYQYPSNFTYAFSERYGISPSQFRNSMIIKVRKS